MIDLSMLSQGAIAAVLQVIMIDLVLAGDNAVVIGLAAAGLPPPQRSKAILVGIVAATLMRLAFAAVAVELLEIAGLLLAGGILLLWVCWKMWRDLRGPGADDTEAALTKGDAHVPQKTFGRAAWQIVIADVSMSLDNVLAVAGAAKGHTWVLVTGLAVAIVLMAVAATYIAKLLARFPWITWIGLLIILYVALDMMWRGSLEIACAYVPAAVCAEGLIAAVSALL